MERKKLDEQRAEFAAAADDEAEGTAAAATPAAEAGAARNIGAGGC
eukprot:COSAG06_NODE_3223_length_5656_cov_23.309340_4_plen_46_part_00